MHVCTRLKNKELANKYIEENNKLCNRDSLTVLLFVESGIVAPPISVYSSCRARFCSIVYFDYSYVS